MIDPALKVANKLSHSWTVTASSSVFLEVETIEYLASPDTWAILGDPEIKARLLLAPLFLRPSDLHPLKQSLMKLKRLAEDDEDEWVRLTAASTGDYDGHLYFGPVIDSNRLVQSTLDGLVEISAPADTQIFRPLEERYLSPCVMREKEDRIKLSWRWGSGEEVDQGLNGIVGVGEEGEGSLRTTSDRISGNAHESKHFVPRDPRTAPKPQGETVRNTLDSSLGAAGIAARGPPVPSVTTASVVRAETAFGSARDVKTLNQSYGDSFPRKSGLMSRLGGSLLKNTDRKGLAERAGFGGLGSKRPSTALGGAIGQQPTKKKAAVIDVDTVAALNRKAALEREKQRQEDETRRLEATKRKLEEKAAEKAAKEEDRARKEAERRAAQAARETERDKKKKQKEEQAHKKIEGSFVRRKEQTNEETRGQRETGNDADDNPVAEKKSTKESAKSKLLASMYASKWKPGHSQRTAKSNGEGTDAYIQSVATAPVGELSPHIASAALHHASMIKSVEAAGLEIDPALLQYMEYGAPDLSNQANQKRDQGH